MVVETDFPRARGTGSAARLSARLSAARAEETRATIYCIYHRHPELKICLYSNSTQ